MKCFRVREVNEVETGLKFQVLDGMGYVPTGGTALPYLRVDASVHRNERIGVAISASLEQAPSKRGLVLVGEVAFVDGKFVPRNSEEPLFDIEGGAIVVLPTGAFQFDVSDVLVPFNADSRSALAIVIRPGQSVPAFRKLNSLSDPMVHLRLTYDGESITFC